MKKPDKIYTLTIMYNDESEEVEYLQETISVEEPEIEPKSMLIDFSDDYWDEDSIKLLKGSYYLAEA